MQTAKRKSYPNDHTAIVAMVNEYGFEGVVRALAEQASRRSVSQRDKREYFRTIEAILGDCAFAIDNAA